MIKNEGGKRTAGKKSPEDKAKGRAAKARANMYFRDVSAAKEAYDAHNGCKALVRYEDLMADTLGVMRRVYSELEMPVDDGRLVRVVEKNAWENVPEREKGPGKAKRKATPGSWSEDLTPRQVEIVERITAPLIEEFYGDRAR